MKLSTEGGMQQMAQDLRLACIDEMLRSGLVDLVDLELCNGPEVLQSIIKTAHDQAEHVIVSFMIFTVRHPMRHCWRKFLTWSAKARILQKSRACLVCLGMS